MKELLRRIYPYKKEMAGIILLRIISAVATLWMPYIMSQIVNTGITGKDWNYILEKGLWMFILAGIATVSAVATTFVDTKVTSKFGTALQKDLFSRVMQASIEEYGTIGTSSLITRCNGDVFILQELVSRISFVLVTFPTLFFGGVALTMMKDMTTGFIMLLISPFVLLIVGVISRQMGTLWKKSNEYIDMQNKLVRERLTGLRVIRAFAKESYEHGRIEDATKQMAHNIIRANVLSGMIAPISLGLLNVVTVFFLFVGAGRIQENSLLTVGDVVASVQYIALIANGLLLLSWSIIFIPRIQVSMRRVLEVLALKPSDGGKGEETNLEGHVSIQNLTFSYPGAEVPALQELNLEAGRGQSVAIIGGTGSGKSTIAKVLMYFFPGWNGEIKLSGKSYGELSIQSVRENIAVAWQKNTIFEGTIEENIRMGKASASEEELKEICKIAQLQDFVESHPEGLSYHLAQGGANLSGGQKQRINIARTVIKPAQVYIFDDSFSALDFLTERNLRRGLNTYLKGKTQIIITQRAATAMHCDHIYVMDQGKIIGEGTHRQLLDSCHVYSEICKSQLGDYRHG